MTYQVKPIVKGVVSTVGEGPHWHPDTQSLLFVDILAGKVGCWSAVTDEVRLTSRLSKYVGFVVPTTRKGVYAIGSEQQLSLLDFASENVTPIVAVDSGKETRFNDGKVDAKGRLWAGTMGIETAPAVLPPNMGSLYRLDHGKVYTAQTGVHLSNGLAWNNARDRMFFIDSIERAVFQYDYDNETGEISNRKVALDLGMDRSPDSKFGFPDGMCTDSDDKLWVAGYSSGKVFYCDPAVGKVLDEVEIGPKEITSVCFGGADFRELFVTSARMTHSGELDGAIFRINGLRRGGAPADIYCI